MFFALICGAVLQALIPTWRGMGQAHAPLLLGIVLYYALSPSRGLRWQAAVLGGLLQDAMGQIPLGYSSFGFCLAVLVVLRFREVVFERNVLLHALIGALASGGVTLMLGLLLAHDRAIGLMPGWAFRKLLGALLLGAVVVPAVYRLLESADEMLGNAPLEDR